MALSQRDIVITSNRGSASDPVIKFIGAAANTSATITMRMVDIGSTGILSFEGNSSQLFSITDSTSTTVSITGGATIQGLTVGLGANAVANNTAVGSNALASGSLSGNSNTALGSYTLVANTTGIGNTALGQGALTLI